MENKIEKAIDNFIDTSEKNEENKIQQTDDTKKVILDERDGLVERFDRIIVDKKGRMLLREQY